MIDVLVIGLVLTVAVAGYKRGILMTTLALLAMTVSGLLGAAIGLPFDAAAQMALAFACIGGLAFGFVVGVVIKEVDQDGAAEHSHSVWRQIDRASGAVLSAVIILTIAWFAGVVAALAPNVNSGGVRTVRQSRVINGLLVVVSPTGKFAALAIRTGLVPGLDGPLVIVDPPGDIELFSTPELMRASSKIVRVSGEACGQRDTGTGWPLSPELIVTNSHVVAGHEWTQVEVQGYRDPFDATIVAFDPKNDVAILSVPGLPLEPLPISTSAKHGDDAVVIGYPRKDGLVKSPARFDRIVEFDSLDIYGTNRTPLDLLVFRGEVRSGNSGSPILNLRGEVIGMVAAQALGQSVEGGYGVPVAVISALGSASSGARVSPGPCISAPQPTAL